MIQINPLQSYIDGGARAAITTPPSASLVFDLPGKAIWVKGVKLKGTDHTYTFSHDNYITLTNTPGSNESEDIKIGVNITTLKAAIDTTYTTGTLAQLTAGTNTTALVWTAKILAQYVTGVLPVTKKMKVNGTDYAIFTTESSLPSFFAPATLGTAGQILSCNANGLVWVNQTVNTDYQVTQSSIASNADYRVILKRSANDTAETTYVNFATTLTYNPSTKILKVNGNRVVTFADLYVGATASAAATSGLVPAATSAQRTYFLRGDGVWAVPSDANTWRPIQVGGSEKLGSATNTGALNFIAGTGIEVAWDTTNKRIVITNTAPDVNHNTHYTTSLYIGANNDTKANAATANPYLKLFDDAARRSTLRFVAGDGITVASDANGNITITNSKPDVNHNTDRTGVKLGTVSGTQKTDSTLIIANSGTGLVFQGGTNLFKIGDGTNYIQVPITPSFTVTNKAATIGRSLTTIATINGTDITAKIADYVAYYHNYSTNPNIDTFTDWAYLLTVADTGSYGGGTKASGSHNGFGVLNLHTHSGNYYTQLGLDTNLNRLWIRSANNAASFGAWLALAYTSEIPTVNNASLTLQTAGTTLTVFYANDSTNRTFNVTCANIGAATSGHNHDKRYVYQYPSGGFGNMNDVARSAVLSSVGMTPLSSSSVDNGDMSSWTHFLNISYADGGAGSNSWIFLLACPAGSSNLQFRSRNGGTITNDTAWATGWTKIAHSKNISNKAAIIGTSLTTIATIAGVDITAKIAAYATADHTHSVKINGSTKTIAAPGGTVVDLGSYLSKSGDTGNGLYIFRMDIANVKPHVTTDWAPVNLLHSTQFKVMRSSDTWALTMGVISGKGWLDCVGSGIGYGEIYLNPAGTYVTVGNYNGSGSTLGRNGRTEKFAVFGNSYFSGSIIAGSFVKSDSSDSYVLLGGGGTKLISDFATSGHTHSLSIAADSGTSSIALAASTKYKLTAGGSTYVFTSTPDLNVQQVDNNNNENVPILLKNGTGTGTIISSVRTVDGVTINPSANSLSVGGNLNVGGRASFGSSVQSNYITFHGLTSDGGDSYDAGHTYIGNRLYQGTSTTSTEHANDFAELVLFQGNDPGGGNALNPVAPGPDRIRHIAAAHLFQVYTSALYGTFEAVCGNANLVSVFAINSNHVVTPFFYKSTIATGTAPIQVTSTTVCGNLNADMVDGYHKTDLVGLLTKNSWNPRGTNLAMDWHYNGGDMSISETGGQISVSIDGAFYQNEGRYRVTDVTETVTALGTSGNYLTWTKNGSTNNITVPYATNSDTVDSEHAIAFYHVKTEFGGRNYYKQSSGCSGQTKDSSINGYIVNSSNGINRISNIGFNSWVGDWTVSFEIKADSAITVNVNLCDILANTNYNEGSSISVTTSYVKHKFTFINVNKYHNPSDYNGFLDIENSQGVKFYVKDIKIEKGVIATDWSLAPEDVAAGYGPYNTSTYADSAGSASSVAWNNVTGKPLSGYSGNNGPVWGNYVPVKSDGVMEIGKYLDFHNSSNESSDFSIRLICQGNNGNQVNLPTVSGTLALTSQIPTVNNASLTLLTAGTTLTTFYANDSTNRTFNVTCANIGAAAAGHNHDGRYSYAHQSDWAYNVAHNSDYVTFDKKNGAGAPSTYWYNGFVSTHSNYLSSYIVNEHRTANWYVGYSENTTAPTWYKLIHSGNYTSYVNPRAVSKSMWGGTYIDASGNFQSFAGNFNMSTGDLLNMTGASWDGFAFNYASGKSGGQSTRFYNGAGTEIVRFLANGNVGIGTTSPEYKLDVAGTGRFTGRVLATSAASSWLDGQRYNNAALSITNNTDSSSYWPFIRWTSSSLSRWGTIGVLGANLYFMSSTTSRTANGYDTAAYLDYTTSCWYAAHYYEHSDARLKHDIMPLSKSIRKFRFNNDNKLYYGFIAQELETLHPELVDNSGEYKTVNYNSAICYYIAELENKVQKLEDEINKLKNK